MPHVDPDDPDLYDDLELACLDTLRGDATGPLTASRLQRACEDVLRRRGVVGAVVRATSTRALTEVRIGLPRPDRTVRDVVLRLR